MITPTDEDVAKAAETVDWYDTTTVNEDDLREVIALALAEVREAERERCAALADVSGFGYPGSKIAAAIRAPDKGSSDSSDWRDREYEKALTRAETAERERDVASFGLNSWKSRAEEAEKALAEIAEHRVSSTSPQVQQIARDLARRRTA